MDIIMKSLYNEIRTGNYDGANEILDEIIEMKSIERIKNTLKKKSTEEV